MQYRTLGRTGIQVSPYALGTLMFATSMGNDPDDSVRIIHKALDAGINVVDTADAYGDSEEVVGRALEGPPRRRRARHQVRPPDRARTRTSRAPPGAGSSPPSRTRCAACGPTTSTSTSSTAPIPHTDIEETLSALTDLIRAARSARSAPRRPPPPDIVEAQWVAERRGLARFHTEQPVYSILNRGIEREVLPTTQRFGMGTLVWGPLGQGLLTGRVRKDQATTCAAPACSGISATSAGSTSSSSSSPSPTRRDCR